MPYSITDVDPDVLRDRVFSELDDSLDLISLACSSKYLYTLIDGLDIWEELADAFGVNKTDGSWFAAVSRWRQEIDHKLRRQWRGSLEVPYRAAYADTHSSLPPMEPRTIKNQKFISWFMWKRMNAGYYWKREGLFQHASSVITDLQLLRLRDLHKYPPFLWPWAWDRPEAVLHAESTFSVFDIHREFLQDPSVPATCLKGPGGCLEVRAQPPKEEILRLRRGTRGLYRGPDPVAQRDGPAPRDPRPRNGPFQGAAGTSAAAAESQGSRAGLIQSRTPLRFVSDALLASKIPFAKFSSLSLHHIHFGPACWLALLPTIGMLWSFRLTSRCLTWGPHANQILKQPTLAELALTGPQAVTLFSDVLLEEAANLGKSQHIYPNLVVLELDTDGDTLPKEGDALCPNHAGAQREESAASSGVSSLDSLVPGILRRYPNLKTLSLKGWAFAGAEKFLLEELGLTVYDCAVLQPSGRCPTTAFPLPNLRVLRLGAGFHSSAVRLMMGASPFLAELSLGVGSQIYDQDLVFVAAACPHLQRVHLQVCEVSEAGVGALLEGCALLESLRLRNCRGPFLGRPGGGSTKEAAWGPASR
eukprot:jgi/Botrbrau1/3896/Bobra.0183s0117.1